MDNDYKEVIGGVTLNYSFYKGTDQYSDGDIEERILDIVKSEENLEEILIKETDWPLLYHLSDIRKNLLEWYAFEPGSILLEIGAGCGAVTGLFCEKCKRVVANDLSKRRSTINAHRNKKYDNLEILVANFEDVKFSEKYDYVTLIGVLEYSIYYIDSDEPLVDMLKKCKTLLTEGGTLIIAIENKYGLKYWAGAREDHTGRLFDSITEYPESDRVRTFSKKQLKSMLSEAGFTSCDFYFPLPDYKMPMEVYAEEYLQPDIAEHMASPAYDRDRYEFFDERRAAKSLLKDGLFDQFANSFLVFAH